MSSIVFGTDAVGPVTPAPTHTNGDIKTVQAVHGATAVRVTTQFVALGRLGSEELSVYRIKTAQTEFQVVVVARPGKWSGTGMLYTGTHRKKCAGLSWKIDYTKDRVVTTIPRSCLGSPRWIRAGAGMASIYGHTQYADDGLTAHPAGNNPLALGPRLYR